MERIWLKVSVEIFLSPPLRTRVIWKILSLYLMYTSSFWNRPGLLDAFIASILFIRIVSNFMLYDLLGSAKSSIVKFFGLSWTWIVINSAVSQIKEFSPEGQGFTFGDSLTQL